MAHQDHGHSGGDGHGHSGHGHGGDQGHGDQGHGDRGHNGHGTHGHGDHGSGPTLGARLLGLPLIVKLLVAAILTFGILVGAVVTLPQINWHSFFFWVFALATCAFAVAVVASSNVVRMAFYLVLALGASSGLFYLAGADFVGAMQLLIYVGGTLVLLIFGVMLTAQGPFVSMKTPGGEWVMAAVVGGGLLAVLLATVYGVDAWTYSQQHADGVVEPTSTPIGLMLEGVAVEKLDDANLKVREGKSGYLLPFEIVSVHLLVVLVGAAYLARSKKRVAASS